MRLLTASSAVALVGLIGCNQPPSAPTVSVQPDAPSTLDALQAVLDEAAVDPNDDPITYTYAWSLDGMEIGDLVADTVPADRTAKGQVWSVVVTPSDEAEAGPSASAEVTIANTAPEISVELELVAPTTSDDLVATATATDADEDELTLTWSWRKDGSDTTFDGPEVPASATNSREAWEVTVVASDGEAESAPATASVTIDNTAPVVVTAVIDPAEVRDRLVGTESVVRVLWTGEDQDGDELDATITWFVDGSSVEGNEDGTLDGRSFAKGSRISAEVVVSDGLSSSEVLATDETIVLNTPPVLSGAAIDPGALTETSTAGVALGTWTDQDADPASYTYSWEVNGTVVGSGTTLDGGSWRKGDTVVAVVTPFDGEQQGAPVSTAPVVIGNTPPVLASVTLSPDPVRTDDALAAVLGTLTDADEEDVSVTHSWTVNGSSTGTSAPTLASSFFRKGDLVAVTATPSDGTDTGAPQTDSITVSNTAPTVDSLVLSPSTLRTADTAGATYTVSDADDEDLSVTVSWTVDGTSAGTGTTLSGSSFSKGDVVTASVVATDGTDSSAPRVASLTVANTAPTTPSVTLDPASPKSSDNIQCKVTGASTDADGDRITYTFRWTKNGTSFTGAGGTTYSGDTVVSSSTAGGDTFVCTLTASDGTDTSGAATASAKVTSGATVPGFSGVLGPTFTGWTQCEGYLDVLGGDQIPTAWGNDCVSSSYNKVKLVCGASTSTWRYIDVNRNVFRDKLTAYPMTGLITAARNQAGSSFTITNDIYASGNDPQTGTSWWNGGNGCGETNTNLTVNNGCTWEASNCFGQGITGNRYLWVYVAP